MSTKRVFFALWPDNQQRDKLRDVINSVAKGVEGRATDRRDWHTTLAFVGDIEERLIPDLLESASRIQVEPFRLGFDRLEYWARAKAACLVAPTTPPELQNVVSALNSVLMEVEVVPEDRTYRPHITVSRNARAFATERLPQRAVTEWSSFELIESDSRPGRSGYTPLKQ
jgi:2'-5' RNA ligase